MNNFDQNLKINTLRLRREINQSYSVLFEKVIAQYIVKIIYEIINGG